MNNGFGAIISIRQSNEVVELCFWLEIDGALFREIFFCKLAGFTATAGQVCDYLVF